MLRRRPDIHDVPGADERHHQPVDAERRASGAADRWKRAKELLVERVVLLAQFAAARAGMLKAAALLGGVAELGEAVRELNAVPVELPALGVRLPFAGNKRKRRRRPSP